MQISREEREDRLELRLVGRLDGYWADHLARELDEVVRAGKHRIDLHTGALEFLSSAGIRVLVRAARQLQAIGGQLAVLEPSQFVREVLALTGLERLIGAPVPPPAAPAAEARPAPDAAPRAIELPQGTILELPSRAVPGRAMRCTVVGEPAAFGRRVYAAGDCREISLPSGRLAFGVGAFGSGFEDCRDRFGEFLALAGAVAYLPTDGGGQCDYLIAAGQFVPQIHVLHAVVADGDFGRQLSFEAKPEATFKLADLAAAALDAAGCAAAVIAIAAEAQGLVGAALRRSPVLASAPAEPLEFPGIRDWLGFTAERAHAGDTVLIGGIVSRAPEPTLQMVLRPLGPGLWAHAHAAAFSYRPLPKGQLALAAAVGQLFEEQAVRGVLHLLADERPISGAGSSEFVRGACWVAPITGVSAEGAMA